MTCEDNGKEYFEARSPSFWTVEYDSERRSAGSDGKISDARYCDENQHPEPPLCFRISNANV
jgi:hypothetical protein